MSAVKLAIPVVLLIYIGEWLVYHLLCSPYVGWALLFNAVFALAVWSYLATALADPGTPSSSEWQAWRASRGPVAPKEPGREEDEDSRTRGWLPGQVSWCRQCKHERPERAHHCSQCASCVLRMDHHCPWVGGCIGWRNHKSFLLLNWWSFWALLVFLLTLRRPNALEAINILEVGSIPFSMVSAISVLCTVVLLFVTGAMFWSSLWMAGRNVTAVEELFSGENPYRLSCLDNLRQLLGPFDLWLFLPLLPAGRPSGVAFQLAKLPDTAAEEGLGAGKPVAGASQPQLSIASSARKYGSM